MLSESIDREKSIEGLEGEKWPPPPTDSTDMVKNVHELRKRPIKLLSADNLARLIGQDIGLPWLLPVALDFLRETAPREAVGGWYDDDLLSAVLTRKPSTWDANPELARHLNETVEMLTDLSSYMEREVEQFRNSLPS